jgi:hypothetical protein
MPNISSNYHLRFQFLCAYSGVEGIEGLLINVECRRMPKYLTPKNLNPNYFLNYDLHQINVVMHHAQSCCSWVQYEDGNVDDVQIGCRFWDMALREHAMCNLDVVFDHSLSRSA